LILIDTQDNQNGTFTGAIRAVSFDLGYTEREIEKKMIDKETDHY